MLDKRHDSVGLIPTPSSLSIVADHNRPAEGARRAALGRGKPCLGARFPFSYPNMRFSGMAMEQVANTLTQIRLKRLNERLPEKGL